MRSRLAITVAAPPRLVFALARDSRRWPALLPHYVSVTPRDLHDDGSVTARMVARRPLVPALGLGLPVAWRARTWSDPGTLTLRFEHYGGATAGMRVRWRIEAEGEGTRVTIEHDFDPPLSLWATFVDRLFVRPIAGRTLATFKAIAEATAAAAEETSP